MTIETIFIWIAVGLVAGQMAATVSRGFGGFRDTVVGISGACLGGIAFHRLRIVPPFRGLASTVFVALVGAFTLLILLRLVRRGWVARNE